METNPLIFRQMIELLPYPCALIDIADHNILYYNAKFKAEVVTISHVDNLSFSKDYIDDSSRTTFNSLLSDMKAQNQTSIRFEANTMTWILDTRCEQRNKCKDIVRYPASSCLMYWSDFADFVVPVYHAYEWTYTELQAVDQSLAYITGHSMRPPKELTNDELDLVDFFQKAPVALHKLTRKQLTNWHSQPFVIYYTCMLMSLSVFVCASNRNDHLVEWQRNGSTWIYCWGIHWTKYYQGTVYDVTMTMLVDR